MSLERHATPAESVRRFAAAAWEALPAILLAAALLLPALTAIAGRTTAPVVPPAPAAPTGDVSRVIAEQGDRALVEIRQDARESLRQTISLPNLS